MIIENVGYIHDDLLGGTRPMTNFEFIQTCTMEELAEWLKEVAHICFACSDMCAETSDEYCKYGYASEKDKWIGWLKEKHDDLS